VLQLSQDRALGQTGWDAVIQLQEPEQMSSIGAMSTSADELTGIVGFAARSIDSLGEWGVGLFTLAETVFPPIPSEVILPLAGFLTRQGSLSLPLVFVASTLGAYAGALALYFLGAKVGLERSIRWLSKLPLVEREDFETAEGWFRRHGKSAIFFGRLLPGVRSLISLPAGAEKMHLGTFSIFTIAGSGIWNGALIGLGVLLGKQYSMVEQYSRFLNYAVYTALAVVVAWLVVRYIRRRKTADEPQ
jgi:membrane protein DedA with SNARE-associated domain